MKQARSHFSLSTGLWGYKHIFSSSITLNFLAWKANVYTIWFYLHHSMLEFPGYSYIFATFLYFLVCKSNWLTVLWFTPQIKGCIMKHASNEIENQNEHMILPLSQKSPKTIWIYLREKKMLLKGKLALQSHSNGIHRRNMNRIALELSW